jgi:transposase-like protein
MSHQKSPTGNPFTNFFCQLFGHRYIVSKNVTHHIKEYKCVHCQKQVTTNVDGSLSELTPELQEINEVLTDIYARKNRRRAQKTKRPNHLKVA